MEVKFENKIKLKSNKIIGMIDKDFWFINYIKEINFMKNNITFNKKKVPFKDLGEFKKKISIVNNDFNDLLNLTVYEYMKYNIFTDMLDIKDYKKKIVDSLRIIGISEKVLDKKTSKLSRTERQWINFSIGLFSNPDVIILNNFFTVFDLKNIKRLMRLLYQLAEQYNKVIVIYSNDSEIIYKLSDYVIILNKDEILLEGDTSDVFVESIDTLLKYGIDIPKTIQFSSIVNQRKNVRLGYFKDIRDLIKDIYKRV